MRERKWKKEKTRVKKEGKNEVYHRPAPAMPQGPAPPSGLSWGDLTGKIAGSIANLF